MTVITAFDATEIEVRETSKSEDFEADGFTFTVRTKDGHAASLSIISSDPFSLRKMRRALINLGTELSFREMDAIKAEVA